MAIALIIIGLILTPIMYFGIRKGRRTQSWPTTGGSVISSHVEEKRDYDDEGNLNRTYYPIIEYEYTVGGDRFQGDSYQALKTSMSRRKARQVVSGYNPGEEVTVFYNPEKPSDAVLVPGFSNILYVLLAMGIILILAGIVVAFI